MNKEPLGLYLAKLILAVSIIVAVGALVGSLAWLTMNYQSKIAVSKPEASSITQISAESDIVKFSDYLSGLEFDYPKSWGKAERKIIYSKAPTSKLFDQWEFSDTVSFSGNDKIKINAMTKDFLLPSAFDNRHLYRQGDKDAYEYCNNHKSTYHGGGMGALSNGLYIKGDCKEKIGDNIFAHSDISERTPRKVYLPLKSIFYLPVKNSSFGAINVEIALSDISIADPSGLYTLDRKANDEKFKEFYGTDEGKDILDFLESFKIYSSDIVNISQWKKYKDTESGYEISYPGNWTIMEKSKNSVEFKDLQSRTVFLINVIELASKDDIVSKNAQNGFDVLSENDVEFLGDRGFQMLLKKPGEELYRDMIVLTKDNLLFKFVLESGASGPYNNGNLFTQLISTFRFKKNLSWETYQNKDYGISFQYPSTWSLSGDELAKDKNLFSLIFGLEEANTSMRVVGVNNKYKDEGHPGWFGYCAVAFKNVDQFCRGECNKIDDKTATRRGTEFHGDTGYSLLAYTNVSKKFPSICWELDLSSILSEVAAQKGIHYYKVTNKDVETYINGSGANEDIKEMIENFETFARSIKSF